MSLDCVERTCTCTYSGCHIIFRAHFHGDEETRADVFRPSGREVLVLWLTREIKGGFLGQGPSDLVLQCSLIWQSGGDVSWVERGGHSNSLEGKETKHKR